MVCYTYPLSLSPGPVCSDWTDHSVKAPGALESVNRQSLVEQLLESPGGPPPLGNPELLPAWKHVESWVPAGSNGQATPNLLPFGPVAFDASAMGPAAVGCSPAGWVLVPLVSMGAAAQEAPPSTVPCAHGQYFDLGDYSRQVSRASSIANNTSPEQSDGEAGVEAFITSRLSAAGPLSASASRRRRRQRAAAFARQQGEAEHGEYHDSAQVTRPVGREPSATSWTDRLLGQLECGGEQSRAAVAELRGCARRLAFEATGCRVLQMALRKADQRDVASLVAELHGCVRRAISSPHGNFVVQAVVEVMPPALAAFVVEELTGVGAEMSRHKYGCRVMCRLLEHSAGDSATVALIDETLQEAGELCRHCFGHHVIESVLEHGVPAQRQRVVASLLEELPRNAVDDSATHVIVAALRHCPAGEQAVIASPLLHHADGLFQLAEHHYGIHVVRALLRLPGELAHIARRKLQQDIVRLQRSPYGSRIADEVR